MASARQRRRWRRRAAVAAGAVVVIGAGGYVAYAQASKNDASASYRLVSAAQGSVAQTLTITGTVARVSQVTAAFPVSGTVTGVLVKVGDTVTPGQQLATIDQAPLQAALTDAQAQLLQAQAQLTTDETATATASGSTGASGSSGSAGSSGSTGSSGSSNATDPVISTTTSCATAVTPRPARLIFTARMPWALDSRAESTESAASWLCGRKIDATNPLTPPGWSCPPSPCE
ncbi:MAG: biotin/lipoyl-binding protein [Lapillicoccus sp.]